MKYQWNSTAGALMLNTDVELVYDIDVDNYGNGTTCKMNAGSDHACAESSTKALVESYASVSLAHIYRSNILFRYSCVCTPSSILWLISNYVFVNRMLVNF